MTRAITLLLCLALSGCGAETVGTAAVAGKAKQEEARQARETLNDVQQRLDEVADLERQRLREMEQAAGQ